MISRWSFIGGLLATPAIVRANSLMKLPTRSDSRVWYRGRTTFDAPFHHAPYIPLVVTSVNAPSFKLAARWTLEESDIMTIKTPDSVFDEIAPQLATELKSLI